KRRHHRGRLRHALFVEPGVAEVLGPHALRRSLGHQRVRRIAAGLQGLEGSRAIEPPGVEMIEAIVLGDAAGERALAGGGRPVHGDDHAFASAMVAPRSFIKRTKPGKLVLMVSPSSIETGRSAARPMTRNAMAMRWSRRAAIAALPRG